MTEDLLRSRLRTLWRENRSLIDDRVAKLRAAESELRAGSLSESTRADANAAAHKLAGALGTFGYIAGSGLAHELEVIFERNINNLSGKSSADVSELLNKLTSGIDSFEP